MNTDETMKEIGEPAEGAGGDADSGPATFEEAFARLEQVVARLERGDAGLEEALALFEEGVALARFCRRRLDEAEARIRVLVAGQDGAEEVDAPHLEPDLPTETDDH